MAVVAEMWWPFCVFARNRKHPVTPSPEAVEAQRRAAEGLQQELNRSAEITKITTSIRKAQVRNHFSEAMEHLIVVVKEQPR